MSKLGRCCYRNLLIYRLHKNMAEDRHENIIKSENDRRSYRGLELTNKMKVLLVSDPETDKSAACLCVDVGGMSEPDILPGLAHFCEHMLFMGSAKYPVENEYDKYLSRHAGRSNAFTYSDKTCYVFEVDAGYLYGALDRFAQFFVKPLFAVNSMEREVNAVNSENNSYTLSDSWRFELIEQFTCKPGHPYAKFITGNKETLDLIPKKQGIDVREELLSFYEKWYSSNIMSLVVIGKESLNDLEKSVLKLFSAVRNRDVEAPVWSEHAFGPDELQTKVCIVPVKDIRVLSLCFAVPDFTKYYKWNPDNCIVNILSYEGPRSVLSVLKSRRLVNSIHVNSDVRARGFGMFEITFELTEEGLQRVNEIVTVLFQYINLLKEDPDRERLLKECQEILYLQFRFKDKELPWNYTYDLSLILSECPFQEVLLHDFGVVQDIRPDLIDLVLGFLKPENLRLNVTSKTFEEIADKVEPYYKGHFKIEKISNEVLEEWKHCGTCQDLKLPPKNVYIPTEFSILPEEDKASPPTVIYNTRISRLWFKKDDEFLLPKENIFIEFFSPISNLGPLSRCIMIQYASLLNDILDETLALASLLDYVWDLKATEYGIELFLSGYNSKLHILLDKIIDAMINPKIDEKRFEILKEERVRTMKNFNAELPYTHAHYHANALLEEHFWGYFEQLQVINEVTVTLVYNFIPQFLSRLHIECLIHGNVSKKTALATICHMEDKINASFAVVPLLQSQWHRKRDIQLKLGSQYLFEVYNDVHEVTATLVYYQYIVQSTISTMILALFAEIAEEPAFNILRTKEQLGYAVRSDMRRGTSCQGFLVVVQSDSQPTFVDKRIEAFVAFLEEYIVNMELEEFDTHKNSLAAKILEKPKTMTDLSNRYWLEIYDQQYNFHRHKKYVRYLRTLMKQDLLDFYEKFIMAGSPNRSKLAVHVLSSKHKEDRGPTGYHDSKQIKDVAAFKSNHGHFPLIEPFLKIPRPEDVRVVEPSICICSVITDMRNELKEAEMEKQ